MQLATGRPDTRRTLQSRRAAELKDLEFCKENRKEIKYTREEYFCTLTFLAILLYFLSAACDKQVYKTFMLVRLLVRLLVRF